MDKIKIFLSGFIIGLGKIMPGVSGSVIAICLGLYERLIAVFSSLKNLKRDFSFFTTISLGIILAIILGSRVIKFALDTSFIYTISLFIGLMLPGLIPLFKEVNNKNLTPKITLIGVLVFFGLILFNTFTFKSPNINAANSLYNFFSLILCGILDAAATIIPGISGSALLLLVGYYDTIISSLARPFSISSIEVLIPFGIGLIIGIIVISKLITYLFKNHRVCTFVLIISFALFSIFSLTKNVLLLITTPLELLISFLFLIIGVILSHVLEQILK